VVVYISMETPNEKRHARRSVAYMTNSGQDQRRTNRRADDDYQPPAPAEGWHLDKKVPLGLIFAMIVQAASVIWFFADIKKDVELLKQDASALHVRDTANSESLKEAMRSVQDQFSRLDAKLDRLIERSGK
jgi:hypothetical protein